MCNAMISIICYVVLSKLRVKKAIVRTANTAISQRYGAPHCPTPNEIFVSAVIDMHGR